MSNTARRMTNSKAKGLLPSISEVASFTVVTLKVAANKAFRVEELKVQWAFLLAMEDLSQ